MTLEGLLPPLQEPATCPYSETEQSIPCICTPRLEDQFYYATPIYAWVFQVASFPQASPPKLVSLLQMPATCLAHPILVDLIISNNIK